MPNPKKNVLAISGSTRAQSSNLHILEAVAALASDQLDVTIYQGLGELPHFNPDLDTETPPAPVADLRDRIEAADGVVICTPEYVFSPPGSLKNALEWTVSTTVFTDKPVALIVASAVGEKTFESLQLILRTIGARLHEETQLLIQSPKSKVSRTGDITDEATLAALAQLAHSFASLLQTNET